MKTLPATPDANLARTGAAHILIVDDDPDILASLEAMLELDGDKYQVCTASSAEEALRVAETCRPDAVLLDIKLKRDSGLDLIPALRAHLPDLVCIMMTAFRDPAYAAQAIRLGANDYLHKPLHPEEIYRALDAQLNRQLLVRQNAQINRRLRAIFDHSYQLLFLLDADGTVLEANDSAEELLGSNGPVPRTAIWQLPCFQTPSLSQRLQTIIAAMPNGKLVFEQFSLQNQAQTPRVFAISFKPLFTPAGDLELILAEGLDITIRIEAENWLRNINETLEQKVRERTAELELAKQEAEASSKAKSAFLANMSHELRTPLNAILGFAQLLEIDGQQITPEHHQDYVSEILYAGRHLLELISEVLDLSRIESGHLELAQEPFGLCELISHTLPLVQQQADKLGVLLSSPSLECGGQSDELVGDRRRLKQVLLNLLSNAVKFNHKDGKVELVCTRTENKFRIEVRDTGCGIPAEYQSQVFKAFERLDAEAGVIEGTGIGLAISKRLIEAMGGCLDFESTPGIGSTFWFELPTSLAIPDKKPPSASP